jgi:preprotein translocase subunit SecE
MKTLKNILLILSISVGLTSFAYLIDCDPPYPNFKDTLKEFFTLTLFVSVIVTIAFYGIKFGIKARLK